MTKLTFFHGVIFRIIISLSAYGITALYSRDPAIIGTIGTFLYAAMFMVIWAIQVSLIARGIPMDPIMVNRYEDDWWKNWLRKELDDEITDPSYSYLTYNIFYNDED